MSHRAGLGEATAAHKWWWSAVLPVQATGKDGVAKTKKLVPSMENLAGKRETKVKRSNVMD